MRIGMLLALIGIVTACSSDPAKVAEINAKRAQQSDPSKGIICTEYIPTGSSFPEKKCTTREQRDAERLHYDTLNVQPAPGSPRGP